MEQLREPLIQVRVPLKRVTKENNKTGKQKEYVHEIKIDTISNLRDEEKKLSSQTNQKEIPPLYRLTNQEVNCNVKMLLQERTVQIPKHFKFISEPLFNELIKWKRGNLIFVSTPTGSGKTTFEAQLFSIPGIKVLILSNRIANLTQTKMLCNYNNLQMQYNFNGKYILSYQELENNTAFNNQWINQFDYIIADESHYFLSDSLFNSGVNISYKKIFSATNSVRIFMSATNDVIIEKILQEQLRYYSYIDLSNQFFNYELKNNQIYIKRILEFKKNSELVNAIKNNTGKSLVFVQSKKKGDELLQEIKKLGISTIFLYRDNIQKDGRKAEIEEYENIMKNSKFNSKCLITTKILDNGVNLVDPDINLIAIFDYDNIEMIQEIGRKRCINKEDKFDLYLYSDTKQRLVNIQDNEIKIMAIFNKIIEIIKHDWRNPFLLKKLISNDDDGEIARLCVYTPPSFPAAIYANNLGYYQLNKNLKHLKTLINTDSIFDLKVEFIKKKLDNNFEVIKENENSDFINGQTQLFLNYLSHYLNKKYDLELLEAIRKEFTSRYIDIFRGDNRNDRKDRPFSAKKINEKLATHNIKIKLMVDRKNKFFKFENSEDFNM